LHRYFTHVTPYSSGFPQLVYSIFIIVLYQRAFLVCMDWLCHYCIIVLT
jgi:hypothetical protein